MAGTTAPQTLLDALPHPKADVVAQALPQASWVTKIEAVSIHPSVAAWDLGAGKTEVLSDDLV